MTEYTGPHMELYRIAGTCLRAERQAQGVSAVELGKRLGVSHHVISYAERGRTRLQLDMLIRACIALDVQPQDMLTRIMRLTPNLSVPRETSPKETPCPAVPTAPATARAARLAPATTECST